MHKIKQSKLQAVWLWNEMWHFGSLQALPLHRWAERCCIFFTIGPIKASLPHPFPQWTNLHGSIWNCCFSQCLSSHWFKAAFLIEYKNFWWVKLAGIATGLVLIPTLFYTYNGAIGKSPDWVNIAIFFISAAVAFALEAWLLKRGSMKWELPWLAFALICLIGVLFVVFTFSPPQLPLFKDPLSG